MNWREAGGSNLRPHCTGGWRRMDAKRCCTLHSCTHFLRWSNLVYWIQFCIFLKIWTRFITNNKFRLKSKNKKEAGAIRKKKLFIWKVSRIFYGKSFRKREKELAKEKPGTTISSDRSTVVWRGFKEFLMRFELFKSKAVEKTAKDLPLAWRQHEKLLARRSLWNWPIGPNRKREREREREKEGGRERWKNRMTERSCKTRSRWLINETEKKYMTQSLGLHWVCSLLCICKV